MPRSISIAIASRARSGGFPCACSAWTEKAGIALAYHLGRALQLTNILRDLDEDAAIGRLYLPREALAAGRHQQSRSGRRAGAAGARRGLRAAGRARARRISPRPTDHGRNARARPCARRASWRAIRRSCDSCERAACGAAPRVRLSKASKLAHCYHPALRVHLMRAHRSMSSAPGSPALPRRVRLAERGERVVVHEAAQQAGGRCRSYHDAALDMTIDNGNHLLLSGNHAALAYLRSDRRARLACRARRRPNSPFIDLASGERWTLRINDGRLPWWMFDRNRRVPGTRARDYLRARAADLGQCPHDESAMSSSAKAGSTSGWSSRCCSPRSTSSRRKARPRLPARSSARRCWRAGRRAGR